MALDNPGPTVAEDGHTPLIGGRSDLLSPEGVEIPWAQFAPAVDEAINRLALKQRDAVLLRMMLGRSWEESARILRISERRANKRAGRGLKKLARQLRKRGFPMAVERLALVCASQGCSAPVPDGLATDILNSVEAGLGKRPAVKLARRTLRAIYWAPWRRRFKLAAISFSMFLVMLGLAALCVAYLWRSGHLMAWFIEFSILHQAKSVPGLAQPARTWPTDPAQPRLNAASVQNAADLFQITNLWIADLKFSSEHWKALEPRRIAPLPDFIHSDGTVDLRNPKAHRSGLAGVLGYDFDWARADFEFGGVSLTNIGARFKGNGTYVGSLYGLKRSFKVGFKKFGNTQQLGGVEEVNFTNMIDDRSYMSDALAYEFFRDAGVPAPRTAYAWLSVSVAGKWERKPLGLYVLVENLGGTFAAERFGSKKTPIFKPVTYRLFEDLGKDWSSYEAIYDLKTKASAAQRQRVIDFSQLVSHADDREFARELESYLDLDEFAGFLAGLVLLSSYDGFLSDGQNFYVYLHPATGKFGFIPWDLDHAWGGFYLTATLAERERASIWHPWTGPNRFLERVMAVEQFKRIYRARLEDLLGGLFVPSRLAHRIDEIAQLIRSPVRAESSFRLERFEQAVSEKRIPPPLEEENMGADRPVHQLKGFIEQRARSVRLQLDGKSKGVRIKNGESR